MKRGAPREGEVEAEEDEGDFDGREEKGSRRRGRDIPDVQAGQCCEARTISQKRRDCAA